MNITQTSNSALAGRVVLDASYISRLRRGKRLMPKDSQIIKKMATFFVHRCTEDYQKKALFDILNTVDRAEGPQLAEEIAHWLVCNDSVNTEQMAQFLARFSDMGNQHFMLHPREKLHLSYPQKSISMYFGVEGKRQAVEAFLSEVASTEKTQELLLSAMRKTLG